jgi:hypothetical protein
MRAYARTSERTAETLGLLTFLVWLLIVGPAGFLLLLGLAYAMVTSNLALGVVCGLIALSPLFLTIVWACAIVAALLAERWMEKAETAEATSRS